MTRAWQPPHGPTPAEERMLSAYDTFDRLLKSKPAEAKRLAYEVAEIAEKYAPQQPQREATKGQNQ